MKIIKEKDQEYRFKTSGPKYLLKGPRMDCGLVNLHPGESFQNHYHEHIEEDFYVLEGEFQFTIDGKTVFIAVPGDFVHVEPGESHFLENIGKVDALAMFMKAPYDPNDKIVVD